ncbi:DUF6086 family protein [Streptomyces sp. NPDC101132]|uniref:DUF6086 family protein n=1 Tax=Streptomyces sp. NPDC101132 TaxID=3366110 RepID=UPI00380D985F
MSYYFESAGDTLWNPSLRIGKLYVSMAEAVGEMLGVPTGLSPRDDDSCQVERVVFTAFAGALHAHYLSARHPVQRELIKGVLLTSLVLQERLGAPLDQDSAENRALREAASALARSM